VSGRNEPPPALDPHLAANRANWDARTPIHVASRTYGVDRYLEVASHLSDVVTADAPHLGDLTGLRVAHVQCHIGTDTLSLARLGATEVVGIDFAPAAVAAARDLAAAAAGGDRVRIVEAPVHAIPELDLGVFDLVYASIGVLIWNPSVADWMRVVGALVAPGGRLYVRDAHPMLLGLADVDAPGLVPMYPYFEREEPLRWEEASTYTDGDAPVSAPVTYEWNHGLAEIVQGALDAGLQLTRLHEGRTLDWRFAPWFVSVGDGTDRWRLPDDLVDLLPLEFTLEARRP
jgi:SAM-dependent methyltransferase